MSKGHLSVFPQCIPESWMAGYLHYHTAFKFPKHLRVSPQELQQEVEELGGSFAFCAGDHGHVVGNNVCPDWFDGKDYYEFVLSSNNGGDGVLLLPTGEYHLCFPELIPKDQSTPFWDVRRKYPEYQPFHHTLIPMISWTDTVCRHVGLNTSPQLIASAEKMKLAITLNHPGLCHLSGHPDPLSIPWLKKMSYMELFNRADYSEYDWALYKHYLSLSDSKRMGVFAGVDFCSSKEFRLSTPGNEHAEKVTYLYVPGERTLKNLHKAWYERRSVAVRGHLCPDIIEPLPGGYGHNFLKFPELKFRVRSFGDKKIREIRILRNGKTLFIEYYSERDIVEHHWRDETFDGAEAWYTIVVEAEGDWLITSPIGFVRDIANGC